MPAEHMWSGWPGAFCLRCFAVEETEECLDDSHPEGCLGCRSRPCPGAPVEMPTQEG